MEDLPEDALPDEDSGGHNKAPSLKTEIEASSPPTASLAPVTSPEQVAAGARKAEDISQGEGGEAAPTPTGVSKAVPLARTEDKSIKREDDNSPEESRTTHSGDDAMTTPRAVSSLTRIPEAASLAAPRPGGKGMSQGGKGGVPSMASMPPPIRDEAGATHGSPIPDGSSRPLDLDDDIPEFQADRSRSRSPRSRSPRDRSRNTTPPASGRGDRTPPSASRDDNQDRSLPRSRGDGDRTPPSSANAHNRSPFVGQKGSTLKGGGGPPSSPMSNAKGPSMMQQKGSSGKALGPQGGGAGKGPFNKGPPNVVVNRNENMFSQMASSKGGSSAYKGFSKGMSSVGTQGLKGAGISRTPTMGSMKPLLGTNAIGMPQGPPGRMTFGGKGKNANLDAYTQAVSKAKQHMPMVKEEGLEHRKQRAVPQSTIPLHPGTVIGKFSPNASLQLTPDQIEDECRTLAISSGMSVPDAVRQVTPYVFYIDFPSVETARAFRDEIENNPLYIEGAEMAVSFTQRTADVHQEQTNSLMVRSIGDLTEGEILKGFRTLGANPRSVKIMCDKEPPYRSKGFGFMTFPDAQDAASALNRLRQNNWRISGHSIGASFARNQYTGVKKPQKEADPDFITQGKYDEKEDAGTKAEYAARNALEGVNASMWSSYLDHCNQKEKKKIDLKWLESGDYFFAPFEDDKEDGLFYDPSSCFFFRGESFYNYNKDDKLCVEIDADGNPVKNAQLVEIPELPPKYREPGTEPEEPEEPEEKKQKIDATQTPSTSGVQEMPPIPPIPPFTTMLAPPQAPTPPPFMNGSMQPPVNLPFPPAPMAPPPPGMFPPPPPPISPFAFTTISSTTPEIQNIRNSLPPGGGPTASSTIAPPPGMMPPPPPVPLNPFTPPALFGTSTNSDNSNKPPPPPGGVAPPPGMLPPPPPAPLNPFGAPPSGMLPPPPPVPLNSLNNNSNASPTVPSREGGLKRGLSPPRTGPGAPGPVRPARPVVATPRVESTQTATSRTGQPVCELCQRQFVSVEVLNYHIALSELHKTNLRKKAEREAAAAAAAAGDK